MPRWKAPPESGGESLTHAQALQDAAAQLGFDWDDPGPVWEKLDEELAELREALAAGDPAAVQHEFGDVLFTLVNLARFLSVDSVAALREAGCRFDARLNGVQQALDGQGRSWSDCSLDELEALWQQAKRAIRSEAP